ncbi:MAG: TRAP transporter substrate-binding protein DctP [Treponema sp.]|jgi:TRAP-type C4-dicarboxylate transport system substrate-binding protein|nr:TRAP transporter substrate-binding protein DctP [Treponema sp.]
MNFVNKGKFCLFAFVLLFFMINPLFAQRRMPPIRLASFVPENTAWGAAINRMAAEWSRATNGEIEVIVYHNATAGDEAEVLRKLRLNDIQAAVLSSVGISSVTPEVMAISYPFLIRTEDELQEVMRRIKPDLDARIQRNGFVTLAWAHAGWVKFFSKSPIYVPNDLRRLKLSTSTEEEMVQAFRIMGFQLVSGNVSQTLPDLNSGRIDAAYLSPILAAGGQIFGVARNMTNLNIAPFMGGILMNETAWRRIPDRYKPQLLEICKRMEKEIEASILNMEAETIATMRRYGLNSIDLTPQQRQEWFDDVERYENRLVGASNPVFHREYYNRIKNILAEYRRGR